MSDFYSVLTTIGKAALANAAARGTTVTLTEMAVGDGNGAVVSPTEDMTELVNEVYRAGINTLDVVDSATMRAELSIPTDQGGFYVREVGIYDNAGQLFAVANLPDTYKPALAEGAGRELTVILLMEISDSDAVTLKIDPTIVLASRQYVSSSITAHNGDDEAHSNIRAQIAAVVDKTVPATEIVAGISEIATQAETDAGTDDERVLTPKKLKNWSGGFDGKVALKSTRSTTGTWSITGLKIGQPLILTVSNTSADPWIKFSTSAGTDDANTADSFIAFMIGANTDNDNGRLVMSSSSAVVIPTASTVSIEVQGIQGTCRAYQ